MQVASEPSIFSENHDYKSFVLVAVNTYVPIFRGLDARGGRKLRTDTHTHTHTHTHIHTHIHTGQLQQPSLCACVPRVNHIHCCLKLIVVYGLHNAYLSVSYL